MCSGRGCDAVVRELREVEGVKGFKGGGVEEWKAEGGLVQGRRWCPWWVERRDGTSGGKQRRRGEW